MPLTDDDLVMVHHIVRREIDNLRCTLQRRLIEEQRRFNARTLDDFAKTIAVVQRELPAQINRAISERTQS